MGLLDKVKNLVRKNEDAIDKGIAKAGAVVDKKTGGKHHKNIEKAVAKAQDLTPDDGKPDEGENDPASQTGDG